ncbi:MAG: ABC transporter ATP-binding protein [Clostridia bacterium]|nr:ABC transporter ATP-binding protein [Clostridia bacterium]
MKTTYLIKRFAPYFKKYFGTLIFDLFCASLTALGEVIFPLIVRYITNAAITDIKILTPGLIGKISVFYIFLRLIDVLAYYYMANRGHVMGAKIETDMRRDLFAKLQEQTFSYFSNNKVGQLMSRITNDLFDIAEFAHHCPEEFFIAGIKIIVSFIILSRFNLMLTLIMFAILPVMLVFCRILNKKMRYVFKKNREQAGVINAQAEDSLLGIRVVKSFTNEELEKKKFDEGNIKFLSLKRLSYKYMGLFQCMTRFFDGLMYITGICVGSVFLMYGKITTADFTAYLFYISTLITSIRKLVEYTEQFQRGITGIERFTEIMDSPVSIKDNENAFDLPPIEGNIQFKNVDFSYEDGNKNVLTKINLDVHKGDNIAIVGSSGGGKTTMCNLIPRFYDVTSGEILIDGINIKNATLKSLRSQIGVVQQDVYLFCGTIAENIAYGKPEASIEEIKEAAKMAGADEFIEKLENGYDAYVGERGIKLSGGQKQRISIARVFLKNPPILILDEATSALDNESEKIVQKSLEKLAKGRTVFTIAHRLTTIKNAKTIIVLTENGIEEQGSHKELMEKHGIYAGLYEMYQN